MKEFCFQKKYKLVLIVVFAMILCASCLFSVPVFVDETSAVLSEVNQTEDSLSLEEYDKFYNSLIQMQKTYQSKEQEDVYSASVLSDDENATEQANKYTRILAYSKKPLDICGAVAHTQFNNYYVLQYETAEMAENAFNVYLNLSYVENLSYDYEICAEEIQVDSTYTYKSWGWQSNDFLGNNAYLSSLEENYALSQLTNNVVAVLDSGLNMSHDWFQGRVLTEYGRNFTSEVSSTNYAFEDFFGHGTHVSGTIVEATPSNVKILPLKVLKSDGRGDISYIISAINYMNVIKTELEEKGYLFNVANMSLGIDYSSSISLSSENQVSAKKATTLEGAVIEAYDNGIFSVVSAGNDGVNTMYASPANVDCAITVSALKTVNYVSTGHQLLFDNSYSNYGSHVDFCAPGTAIESAYIGNYYTKSLSGTSMAAPHVSGCLALIYSNPIYKNSTLDEIYALIKSNANRSKLVSTGIYALGTSERNDYYGYGVINIANIEILVEGEVEFSQTEEYHNSAFNLQLSYVGQQQNQYVRIRYTTDESVVQMSSTDGYLYSSAISIDKTTKISAVAFVYNSNNKIIAKSKLTSKIYYFDNYDLQSKYSISSGIITSYSGTALTTLNVSSFMNSQKVVGISSSAFNNSAVEVLNLPDTVKYLYDSAFYYNSKLKELNAVGVESVGANVFWRCSSLQTVNLPKVKSIGEKSFAYAETQALVLPNIVSIGNNVFSNSKIKTVMLGKNLESIGSQVYLSLTKIYGYAANVSETFAREQNVEFKDLSLAVTKDFPDKFIIKQNENFVYNLGYSGYEVSASANFSGGNISPIVESTDDFTGNVGINIGSLQQGEYTLTVELKDFFKNTITSKTLKLIVVSNDAGTINVELSGDEFEVYCDGILVGKNLTLFKNYEYTFKIEPLPGINVVSLVVDGQIKSTDEEFIVSAIKDFDIKVETTAQEILTISFNTSDKGYVVVNGQKIENSMNVRRKDSLSFEIVSNVGFKVLKAMVGEDLLIAQNGVYTIENLLSDTQIDCYFEEAYYTISLTISDTCGSYSVSHGGTLDNVAHGEKRVFTISPKKGYEIDFVSVNGNIIEVTNNTFTLENVDENKNIVVSFKKVKNSLFAGENSVILKYFIAILIVFFILLVIYFTTKLAKKKKV